MVKKDKDKELIIGIQGGKGSFNDGVCREYCENIGIKNYTVKYLYTTRKVLKALHEKKIDRGVFAIENTIGGTVMETINALSEYNCQILDNYQINITHTLYGQDGVDISNIKEIMSHPHAILQCKKMLSRLYPKKKIVSGKGNLIDSATAAKALSSNKLNKTTAVLAPPMCREYYKNLSVLKKGLRDKRLNYTSFLFVGRFNGRK